MFGMVQIYRWTVAVVLYLLMVLLLLATRPALMFDARGHPKPFGVGLTEGYSFLAPSASFPILAVVSFLASTMFYVVMI